MFYLIFIYFTVAKTERRKVKKNIAFCVIFILDTI